ncbi:hypothetical protein PMAYCL1PPCAC_29090, partial [Pristionchus mayeri]
PSLGLPSIAPPIDYLNLSSLFTLNTMNAVANIPEKLPGVNKRVYYCQRCLNHGKLEPRKNHKCECQFAHCTCSKCILVEKRRVLNTQLHELEESESKDKVVIKDEMIYDEGMGEERRSPGHPRIKGGSFPLLRSLSIGLSVSSSSMMTSVGFYPSSLGGSRAFELSLSAIKHVLEPEGVSYTKRIPNCQKCGQHGRKSRLKGHKRVCPYRDCNCPKCQVVSERQKLMADQIKIRRRQRKEFCSQRKDTLMNLTRENLTATLNAAAAFSAAAASGQQLQFNLGEINSLLMTQLKPPGGHTHLSLPPSTLAAPMPSAPISPTTSTIEATPGTPVAPTALYPFSLEMLKQNPFLLGGSSTTAATSSTGAPSSPQSPTSSTPSSLNLSSALESVIASTKPVTVGAGSPSTNSTTPSPSLGSVSSPTTLLPAPVAINPTSLGTPTQQMAFGFPMLPPVSSTDAFIQTLLANFPIYRQIMEQGAVQTKLEESELDDARATPSQIIDVCSV